MSYPAWAESETYENGSTYTWVGYGTIVNSWGYEVLSFDTCGSYQGDHVVLLADGDRRGVIMIGYGSCSGCDHLEAISPSSSWRDDANWSDVEKFREELRSEIHWENSAGELALWLHARLVDEGSGTDWYWYDDEVKGVTRKYIDMLVAS